MPKLPYWGPGSAGRDDPRDPNAPIYEEEPGFNRDRISIIDVLEAILEEHPEWRDPVRPGEHL